MATFNKIGFHTSAGGNMQGLGDWMRALDAAGIPFCIKGADSAGPVFEGQEIAKASGMPHVLVFRRSGLGWDIPDYELPPENSAQVHWERHRERFPPELDKSMVWFETINEVDKERSDWLGHFAYFTGLVALQEGYKFAAFGWSSGEPEREHWQTPGMLRYLKLCAKHREQLAVSLHEYSYTNDDIQDGWPHKVGRFQILFDVCDQQGIARPTTIITEWGWEYQSVPVPKVAMEHIKWAAKLYAQYPQILGANLWHLGSGYGGIDDQAQKLIASTKDFSLSSSFPDAEAEETNMPSNQCRFIADVTVPDGAVFNAGDSFLKTWRVKNNGDAEWTAGYEFVFVDGKQMGAPDAIPLPAAKPGEQLDVSVTLTAPDEIGVFRSYWQPRDNQGNLFSRPMWAEIEIKAPEEVEGFDKYHFVADITILDGMEMEASTDFIKTWRVRNTGTTTWKKNYQLAFVSGTQLGGPLTSIIKKNVSPGQVADISIKLRVPAAPGFYHGNWCLCNHKGESIGHIMWVEINVPGDVPVVDGFHWPVGNKVNLDDWYDANPFLRRNGRGEYHPGSDFNDMGWGDHDLGAPIYSIAHGLVTAVGFYSVWGNLVLVEHRMPDGSKVWSQYAHFKDTFVKKGDVVQRGQKLGTIGKGDNDRFWAHLHFEIRRNKFHIASWHVRDPEAVKTNYFDPITFIPGNFAPVE